MAVRKLNGVLAGVQIGLSRLRRRATRAATPPPKRRTVPGSGTFVAPPTVCKVAPEATPALYRYDGPFYQDFRSHLRERVWPPQLDVAVLSAKFGLIGALTEIEDYDQRMTSERAAQLAAINPGVA